MEPKYPLDVDDLIYQDEWQISERYARKAAKSVALCGLPASLTELAVPQRSELFLNQEKNAVLFLT